MAISRQASLAGMALARPAKLVHLPRMEHLRAWRLARGWTLAQLATMIGQHLTTVQKWEKGLRAVDMDDVAKLAKAFGVHPVALFFSPSDLELARRISEAMTLLAGMDKTAADAWLRLGASLPPQTADPALDKK
jgi:transcriptional regulator with XRE-family HTH domain